SGRGSVQVEIGVKRRSRSGGAIGADWHDDVANRIGGTHLSCNRIQRPALNALAGSRDQGSVLIHFKIAGAGEDIVGHASGRRGGRSFDGWTDNEEPIALNGGVVGASC